MRPQYYKLPSYIISNGEYDEDIQGLTKIFTGDFEIEDFEYPIHKVQVFSRYDDGEVVIYYTDEYGEEASRTLNELPSESKKSDIDIIAEGIEQL